MFDVLGITCTFSLDKNFNRIFALIGNFKKSGERHVHNINFFFNSDTCL